MKYYYEPKPVTDETYGRYDRSRMFPFEGYAFLKNTMMRQLYLDRKYNFPLDYRVVILDDADNPVEIIEYPLKYRDEFLGLTINCK